MPSFELGFGLALRLLLLLAIVASFFGPVRRRARRKASHGATNRATAEPARRDIFLRDRPMLMLLVWGGLPAVLAFAFLSLVPAD